MHGCHFHSPIGQIDHFEDHSYPIIREVYHHLPCIHQILPFVNSIDLLAPYAEDLDELFQHIDDLTSLGQNMDAVLALVDHVDAIDAITPILDDLTAIKDAVITVGEHVNDLSTVASDFTGAAEVSFDHHFGIAGYDDNNVSVPVGGTIYTVAQNIEDIKKVAAAIDAGILSYIDEEQY